MTAPLKLDLRKIGKPWPVQERARKVWRSIRQHVRFTLEDIAIVTELTVPQVRVIINRWRRARIVRDDSDGYRLARDLGPQPPFQYGKVNGLVCRQTGEVFPYQKLTVRRPARYARRSG